MNKVLWQYYDIFRNVSISLYVVFDDCTLNVYRVQNTCTVTEDSNRKALLKRG